jgi:RNA polymerase sigma-70 factor (ECF subfamily)
MELVKAGNKKAFEELVLKNRSAALKFAQKYVRDEFMAEDIVQDSFAVIYIKRMEYMPKYSFKTFLYTIIRNKCIDYLRKNKCVSLDEVQLSCCSAEEVVIDKEERAMAVELLGSLNKEYQTALYLYEYEDMSYKEIAKIMNKSMAQVKIIIFRARKKMLKAVKEGYKC